MPTALISLAVVAVCALALAACLAFLLVRERRSQDDVLLATLREFAQERSELVNRIQRPEVLQPTPADRDAASRRKERDSAVRRELASAGTVSHVPPAERK